MITHDISDHSTHSPAGKRGHEFAYTVGYVEGAIAGVVVQIGIGVLSGGASAPACTAAILKVGLAAARVYSFIDTVAAVGQGIQQAHNLVTNSGNMTGWQIAGNVAMIGLNFAPALGAAGGAALKKLNGPDFLKLGGCFVAGTPVHLSASPVAVSELELAYAESAFESGGTSRHAEVDLAFGKPEPRTVAIEEVPLGARVGAKNPERFDYDTSLPEVDRHAWSKINMVFHRDDGVVVDAELLRPDEWVIERGAYIGSRLPIHIDELDVHGFAEVTDLSPCPEIADGDGEVDIGRFATRQVTKTIRLTMQDGTVLEGTPVHPI